MKICISGNCQAQHMEMMLGVSNRDLEILRLPPVFLMSQADKDRVYATMDSADAVYMQRVSNEYGIDWIASDEIRRCFGEKVSVWPNLYFDGYFPGVKYIYLSGWGKLLSPLGEYHFDQIHAAHGRGLSIDEAVERFAGEALFETAADPIGQSLDRLRSREADVDVAISDVIAAEYARERLFYTPNHPVNMLLARMLQRLTERSGIAFDAELAAGAPYRLDECYIAASPAVVNRFALPFDRAAVYRGREVATVERHSVTLGGPRDYGVRDLVEAFYRLYDGVAAHSRAA
jgi:hypothetical protein